MRGTENLEWNTDLIETMKFENLVCQATQGLYSEVVEVLEPLKEAVSIPVEALTNEARWEMEKEQQIHINIEMYDEVQRHVRRRGCLQAVVDTIGREGTRQLQSVMMMLQQTKSGPTLRNNRMLNKQQ